MSCIVEIPIQGIRLLLRIFNKSTLESLIYEIRGNYSNLPREIEFQYHQSIEKSQRRLVFILLVAMAAMTSFYFLTCWIFLPHHKLDHPENAFLLLVNIPIAVSLIATFVVFVNCCPCVFPCLGKPIYSQVVYVAMISAFFLWAYSTVSIHDNVGFSIADVWYKIVMVQFWFLPWQILIYFWILTVGIFLMYCRIRMFPMDFVFYSLVESVLLFILLTVTNLMMKNISRNMFVARLWSFYEVKRMKKLVQRKLKLMQQVIPRKALAEMREKKTTEDVAEDAIKKEQVGEVELDRVSLQSSGSQMTIRTDFQEFDKDDRKLGDFYQLVEEVNSSTIVFVRINNFEEFERILSADELVRLFDRIYSDFDHLLSLYCDDDETVYRIKTINHLYMISSGFPNRHPDNLQRGLEVSLKIIELVRNKEYGSNFGLQHPLEVTIGLNHGTTVCGVVGKIPQYDCWSEAVNIASRHCSTNTTPMTVQLSKDIFIGKGVAEMNLPLYSSLKKQLEVAEERSIRFKGAEEETECIRVCLSVCTSSSPDLLERVSTFRRIGTLDSSEMSDDSISSGNYINPAKLDTKKPGNLNTTIRKIEDLFGNEDKEQTLEDMGIKMKEEDFDIKYMESIAKLFRGKHLRRNLYNEKNHSLYLCNAFGPNGVISLCTCHFWNCCMNIQYIRYSFKRYISTNRLLSAFFIIYYSVMIIPDLLRNTNEQSSFMDLNRGTALDWTNFVTWHQLVFFRGILIPLLFAAAFPIFTPCYKYSCCNCCSNIFFFFVFGVCMLSLCLFGEMSGTRDIFIAQLLIFNFGGVHLYVRLTMLSINLCMLVIYKSFENQFHIDEERTFLIGILNCVPGIGMTIAIAEQCFVEHSYSIIDFYIRGQAYARRKNSMLEEKECSTLMGSILPEAIIRNVESDDNKDIDLFGRLSNSWDRLRAQHIEETDLLFADAYKFTHYCTYQTPIELVTHLGRIISKFDELTEKHNLARIKVIGDCYEVCTIPYNRSSPRRMALFALSLIRVVKRIGGLEFRVGIHHGGVFSGIVGRGRVSFDVFGKNVLIAEEYESRGERMKIHCSEEFKKCYAHSVQGSKRYGFLKRSDKVMIYGEEKTSYWLVEKSGKGGEELDGELEYENHEIVVEDEVEGEDQNMEDVSWIDEGVSKQNTCTSDCSDDSEEN